MRLKRLRGFDEFPASSGERFQGGLLQTEFTFSVPRGGSRILVCDIGGVQTTLPRESLGSAPITRIPRPGETGLCTELFTLDTRCSGIPLCFIFQTLELIVANVDIFVRTLESCGARLKLLAAVLVPVVKAVRLRQANWPCSITFAVF